MDAASCGWVARRRACWLSSRKGDLLPQNTPPEEWGWATCEPPFCGQLLFKGSKPVPPRVFFEQGFKPLWSPGDVLRGLAKPFFVFTREFFHPLDQCQGSSAAAVQRFHADSRRFPAAAYEEASLLWRQSEWRVPAPDERSMMMGDGYPAGVNSWGSVVNLLRLQFDRVVIPENVWALTGQNLECCNLRLPQAFAAFQRGRGQQWHHLPPRPLLARDRAEIFAGNSGQRYASDTSKGLDHLLPPGLGKSAHMSEAMRLPSPFAAKPWPEADISFLNETLRVAPAKNPAFIAVVTALLRWPDLTQAQSFLFGLPIVGDVPFSGVFRNIHEAAHDVEEPSAWLEREGSQVVDDLLTEGPPKDHDVILRGETDRLFGHGKWRPLERFVISQPDGKQRVIDNARKTGHNAHTQMLETIHTVSVDFVASCSRDALHTLFAGNHDLSPPACDWLLLLRLGTDDLPDAYRGHPVAEEHLRFSVISVWVPGCGWRFSVLWGLAYGLEAAVVAFNRLPLLGIAACRRMASSFCAAYFDDELSLEFVRDADVSQRGLHLVFGLMGSPPQPAKRFWAAANRCYLGTSVHVGQACSEGTIRVQPKTSSVQKVVAKLGAALESKRLSRDEAGKLRGDVQWLFASCHGAWARFAGPVLQRCQYGDDPVLAERDLLVLSALRSMAQMARPRDIEVWSPPPPCMLIYTDASFEDDQLRLGWVIFAPPPYKPLGGTCAVPPQVVREWLPRRQQIFPGEALCLLILPLLYPHVLEGHDLLWFIDNAAAVSAAVKAASAQEDVFEIVHMACLLRARLGCRSWFEWVGSDSNPSDGLSRLGIANIWTCGQPWWLEEVGFPPKAFRSTLRTALLRV
ncbi:unnamed protein product [Symbiodinium sp. CCMP2592]|nr:unnamed protein product [Symbiodinium sp. CCMP2592]